jgi:putative ABC transport system permease protein
MKLYLLLLFESFRFSMNALIINKLRSFLSLLGITIGIFAVISVLTMVDSLERSIRGSIESLGNDVVFVQKWPWSFGSDYPWWKYINRPEASIKDLKAIRKQSNNAEASVFLTQTQALTAYKKNSIEKTEIEIVSDQYERVRNFEIESGRYFSYPEQTSGKAVAVIGNTIAEILFGETQAIGKSFSINKYKVEVVGVISYEGEGIIGNSLDQSVIIPLEFGKQLINLNDPRKSTEIMVKARPGISNEELMYELAYVLRASRGIRPGADDNFALNQSSLLQKGFESVFGVLNLAGFFIGIFALIVGGFGIANIMFVSVKERTGIIGIQKALGAKRGFILFQFLSESVILCMLGGGAGLAIIYLGALGLNSVLPMEIVLSAKNIILGLSFSVFIGLVSGMAPAISASKLHPVEAIRKIV